MADTPNPPEPLGTAGSRLWKRFHRDYDLSGDADATVALSHVAAMADRRAILLDAVKRDGDVYRDRFDQPKLHPAVPEIRRLETAMAAALKAAGFGLEPLHDSPGRPAGG